MTGLSYAEVMARKNAIMKKSLLLDYDGFEGRDFPSTTRG